MAILSARSRSWQKTPILLRIKRFGRRMKGIEPAAKTSVAHPHRHPGPPLEKLHRQLGVRQSQYTGNFDGGFLFGIGGNARARKCPGNQAGRLHELVVPTE